MCSMSRSGNDAQPFTLMLTSASTSIHVGHLVTLDCWRCGFWLDHFLILGRSSVMWPTTATSCGGHLWSQAVISLS